MNEELHLSDAGANLVKAFEGLLKKIGPDQYRAYVCPAGVTTIGWGTTAEFGRKLAKDTVWNKKQCDDAFLNDMRQFEDAVKKLVKVPLTQNRFDALTSFCYNCGSGNLAKSGLLRKVNQQDWQGAADEFPKWNKGGGKVLPGLVRRRASERLLFLNIPDLDYDGKPDKIHKEPDEPMPQAVDAPDEA